VGDLSFVNKSLRYLYEYKSRASAIIYVSHHLDQIRALADRVLILDHGRCAYLAEPNETIRRYQELALDVRMGIERAEAIPNKTRRVLMPSSDIRLIDFGLLDRSGKAVDSIGVDDPLTVYCDFEVRCRPHALHFSLGVLDELKRDVIWLKDNDFHKHDLAAVAPGSHRLRITIPEHHLMPGVYYPRIAVEDAVTLETYVKFNADYAFAVRSSERLLARGLVRVEDRWDLQALPPDWCE
jgi:hypothetical protein